MKIPLFPDRIIVYGRYGHFVFTPKTRVLTLEIPAADIIFSGRGFY
jgi:hypothetical protein